MPKYLVQASYTAEGFKGLQKDGAQRRAEMLRKACSDLGGTVETLYFSFGEQDVVIISDFPDQESFTSLMLAVAGTGSIRTRTTPLLTPAEVDAAFSKKTTYKAPGQV